jgi:chorismate mutase
MTKLVVEIFDDGAISWTRPATQSEIDEVAGTKELRAQLAEQINDIDELNKHCSQALAQRDTYMFQRDKLKGQVVELRAKLDSAASPQMREDAGRASKVRELIQEVVDTMMQPVQPTGFARWRCRVCNHYGDSEQTISHHDDCLRQRLLIAAGLLKEAT